MPVKAQPFCERKGRPPVLQIQGPQDSHHSPTHCPSPAPGLSAQRVDAMPNSRLPKPRLHQVHFHDSFLHSKSVNQSTSHAQGGPFLGKTQKNLISGPEAVDCSGKSGAKTINLCRVPQLARVVKKIIPQQNQ